MGLNEQMNSNFCDNHKLKFNISIKTHFDEISSCLIENGFLRWIIRQYSRILVFVNKQIFNTDANKSHGFDSIGKRDSVCRGRTYALPNVYYNLLPIMVCFPIYSYYL